MPRTALGDVEHFVLIALLHLGGEGYSVRIMDEIRRRVLHKLDDADLSSDNPLLLDGYVYRMVLQHEYRKSVV